jgi:hypothetical protein
MLPGLVAVWLQVACTQWVLAFTLRLSLFHLLIVLFCPFAEINHSHEIDL